GSYRRAKETLHDLDFLVATKHPAELTTYFTQLPEAHEIIARGDTKAAIRLENGLQCDLRAVSNEQFPFALQYFTGSKEHNVALRSLAQKKHLSLNEYGFTPTREDPPVELPDIHEEADIYAHLGLDPIPPELRENRGEIEAADAGQLPTLLTRDKLRGTFHNHTTASDGAHTLEEMAQAAIDLGLTYLGIADHSKASFQANGLDEERLLAQIADIKKLNTRYQDSGFQLLTGTEVDILKDGSLDFPDELLAQLDYSVASVHNAFTLSEKDMTARLIRAMENEHVTILGHATGRLLLRREPYALNLQKIIDCAAETRTVIELNASPSRLDMDWRWWKRAADQGVLCAINPDAHHTEQLQYLHFGVLQARKGWLTKAQVLNTRPLPDILTFLQTPKHQRQ
ncbi:MAG: PHP domain-containing protein, partial [Verrucomicrobiales bacterium]